MQHLADISRVSWLEEALNKFNFIGLTDIFTGGIIFGIGCKFVHFQWTLVNAIEIIVVAISAAVIRASIYSIFCSIAHWECGKWA
jgi:ABC-type uncharacterized transport system permease subunit